MVKSHEKERILKEAEEMTHDVQKKSTVKKWNHPEKKENFGDSHSLITSYKKMIIIETICYWPWIDLQIDWRELRV